MSVDTIRCSTPAWITSFTWADSEMQSTDMITGEVNRKYITKGKENNSTVPRLTFYPGKDQSEPGRLVVEVSLPKFAYGENASLLRDGHLVPIMDDVSTWVGDKVGELLLPWQEWNVSRLDSVWSWAVGDNISHYLSAFQDTPVYNYVRSPYTDGENVCQGFTWHAKSRKVNAYDKGYESGLESAEGVLRLEIQALNSSAVRSVAKRNKVEQKAINLIDGDVNRGEVNQWLKRIGMAETIPASNDIFSDILEKYGAERAASRILFLEGYKRFGSGLQHHPGYSKRTYKRRRAEAKRKGWLLGANIELDGLEVCKESDLTYESYYVKGATGGTPENNGARNWDQFVDTLDIEKRIAETKKQTNKNPVEISRHWDD